MADPFDRMIPGQRRWIRQRRMFFVSLPGCVAALFATGALAQSTCFGRVDGGKVEGAVSLPREGPNFVRMAPGPVSAGRRHDDHIHVDFVARCK